MKQSFLKEMELLSTSDGVGDVGKDGGGISTREMEEPKGQTMLVKRKGNPTSQICNFLEVSNNQLEGTKVEGATDSAVRVDQKPRASDRSGHQVTVSLGQGDHHRSGLESTPISCVQYPISSH